MAESLSEPLEPQYVWPAFTDMHAQIHAHRDAPVHSHMCTITHILKGTHTTHTHRHTLLVCYMFGHTACVCMEPVLG